MYQKTDLPNGLRVVTHEMKERESVGLGFLVGAGGRYESDRVKGAAHFLEHILFKGSQKYSCEDIKEKIEGVGGSLNAFTTEELTCYYAKIPAKHLNKTFDVLCDMVIHPLIPQKEVEKECGVIVEEIKMYHDLPQYYVLEQLDSLMWPGHPLGKSLIGTMESVNTMTSKDLKGFHRAHYSPNNIVVAACGCLKHQSFVNLVKKSLRQLVGKRQEDFIQAENTQSKARVRCIPRDIEQMHLALGMFGLKQGHKDRYAMALLNIILGGNMSSRLFNEVREKRGLAYSISSSVKSLKDTGLFLVRAGVDNNKLADAVALILKELKKIKRNGVKPGEFSRARDYFLGQVQLGLEDTLDHMLWIGDETITHNRVRTLKDVVKKINQVTPGDIKRLSQAVFDEKKFNLSVIGPISKEQERDLQALLGVK